MKLNMIICMLPVLLLLLSIGLVKCTSSPLDSFRKLCLIVSSIGTFDDNLAGFPCDLLSPLVPNDHSCKDTFSFVSQIKNANLSKKFLVSYDVTSLFTNNNYIVHESNGDRNRNLSLEEYLNKLNFPRVI